LAPESPSTTHTSLPVSRAKPFWKLFRTKSCSIQIKAASKDEILCEIVAELVKGGALDAELAGAAEKALLEREELASTGVGQNVATPHVKLAGIDEAVASLCVHPEGVEWAAVDGEPVRVFFTVLRPERAGTLHDPERHLEMMRWIASLARNEDFRRFACAAKTRKELVDLLKEMS
jgi:mannitol/fructose-specific phosphotransferase system IIA component (Ntr-type)